MTDLTNHLIGYTIDWNGSPMSDEAPTLTDVSCGLMRKAAARIEALEGALRPFARPLHVDTETLPDRWTEHRTHRLGEIRHAIAILLRDKG